MHQRRLHLARMRISFGINMPSHYDKMLDVLRDASIAYVEWRMFYNNEEGDLDFVIATFSDGSRGPLPDEVREKMGPGSLWHLADYEVFDPTGARFNGLFVLDVNERIVARTAEFFYDYDGRYMTPNRSSRSGGMSTSAGMEQESSPSGRSCGSEGLERSSTKRRSRKSKKKE